MKKCLLIIFLLGFWLNLFSQEITVSGYVVCSGTRERIPGANVYEFNSKTGTTTNEYGFYNLTIPEKDSAIIVISHVAYSEVKYVIPSSKNLHLDIVMESGYLLKEVTVKDSSFIPIEKRLEISSVYLPLKQLEKIPSIIGEPDILRSMQLTPGVQTGGEGSVGIFVRGGSPEQNLFLIDDVPLYYVNHLGGFISVFNSNVIKSIKFYKGGFPANFGNRISSVMDVKMKDGNMQKFKGNLSVGLMSSNITLEGPLKVDTTSYVFSARRFMYDIIMLPLSYVILDDQSAAYTFYDLNFRITHKINKNNSVIMNSYLGNDRFIANSFFGFSESKTRIVSQWGNNLASFVWKHNYGNNLNSSISLSYSKYRTSINTKNILKDNSQNFESELKSFSGISDIISKIDFDYNICKNLKIQFGISGTYTSFLPGSYSYKSSINNLNVIDTSSNQIGINAFNNSAYLSGEFYLGKYLSGIIGLRMAHYNINSKNYFSPEPRTILSYQIPKAFTVKVSYSEMHQSLHMLSSTGVGIPIDRWFPATHNIAPSHSRQVDFGIARSFFDNALEFSVDAYYKELDNLITYKEGFSFAGFADDWTNFLEIGGDGKSKGVEFFLNKTRGRMTGFLSYTLSRTTRQFENINNGEEYFYKYDRTHDIAIVWAFDLKDNVNIAASWVYGTGNAISLPTGIINTIEQDVNFENQNNSYNYNQTAFIYDGVNNHRMRAYHRLDFGVNFIKSTKWGERILNISIYNVYNRQNPYYYFMQFDDVMNKYNLKQQSLFPFMPTVSYSVNFNKVSIGEGLEQYKRTKAEWLANSSKNNIGLQFNKWLGYGDGWDMNVFALRYGYSVKKYLRIGAEFSGYRRERYIGANYGSIINHNLNIGLFVRCKYSKLKYLHPFFETSCYYSYNYFITENEPRFVEHQHITGYIAPGITLNVLKGGLNFDIFYKFAPLEIIDSKKSVITWRIGFNF